MPALSIGNMEETTTTIATTHNGVSLEVEANTTRMLNAIRNQLNSTLENQRQAAILLKAVEEIITGQSEPLIPSSYLGVLTTLLSQQLSTSPSPTSTAAVVAATYLLSIITPAVPHPILRQIFPTFSGLLHQAFLYDTSSAPLIRSVILILCPVLTSLPASAWNPSSSATTLLLKITQYISDVRPKVRKLAVTSVSTILATPPSPLQIHPVASSVCLHIISMLDDPALVSHTVIALSSFISYLKSGDHVSRLLASLLLILSKGSGLTTSITKGVFTVFETYFNHQEGSHGVRDLVDVVETLAKYMTPVEDKDVTPVWIHAIGLGLLRIASLVQTISADKEHDSNEESDEDVPLNQIQSLLTTFLSSTMKKLLAAPDAQVINATDNVLCKVIENGIPNELIDMVASESVQSCEEILAGGRWANGWGACLNIVGSLFFRLGMNALPMMQNILLTMSTIHTAPSFSHFAYKSELSNTLSKAVAAVGLSSFLSLVPLNLDPGTPSPRPWLVPILDKGLEYSKGKMTISETSLIVLQDEIIPLASRMYNKSSNFAAKNSMMEARLYETLGTQLWRLIIGVTASIPSDIHIFPELFPIFERLLSEGVEAVYPGLPAKPDLEFICSSSLKHVLEGYMTLSKSIQNNSFSWTPSQQNQIINSMEVFSSQSVQVIKILCDRYLSITITLPQQEREVIESAIGLWIQITDITMVENYMASLLESILKCAFEGGEGSIHSMLDLCGILITRLDSNSQAQLLYYQVLTRLVGAPDTGIQKRSYRGLEKVVPNLFEYKMISPLEFWDGMMSDDTLSSIEPGARRARLECLSFILESMKHSNHTSLEMTTTTTTTTTTLSQEQQQSQQEQSQTISPLNERIALLVGEAVLGTKDASEKGRTGAYDVLVRLGHWSLQGGLEEGLRGYIMMVAAGLGGMTPSMKAASIAALARIMFEFNESMDLTLIQDILSTVLLLLNSPTREIVKSVLGFIKVVIVVLDQEYLQDHLETIIVGTLGNKDTKHHFKSKVRHIIERLIRRFSMEAVEGFVPETEKKLLINIRKRKERSRRRKDQAKLDDESDRDEEEEVNGRPGHVKSNSLKDGNNGVGGSGTGKGKKTSVMKGSNFEDALHGSESELGSENGDDDDDYIPARFKEALSKTSNKTNKKKSNVSLIRETDDTNVTDFLDSTIVSQLVSSAPTKKTSSSDKSILSKKRNPFQIEKASGKYIINEDEEKESEQQKSQEAMDIDSTTLLSKSSSADNDYLTSLKGEGAFTRLPSGKIKFIKTMKQSRRGGGMGQDDDGDHDEGMEEDDDGNGMARSTTVANGWGMKKKKHGGDGGISKMLGRQFKAKRAGGDIKKGDIDPYAYIPLNPKIVGNRRKSTKLAGQFRGVLRAAQTGTDVAGKSTGRVFKKKVGGSGGNKKHK